MDFYKIKGINDKKSLVSNLDNDASLNDPLTELDNNELDNVGIIDKPSIISDYKEIYEISGFKKIGDTINNLVDFKLLGSDLFELKNFESKDVFDGYDKEKLDIEKTYKKLSENEDNYDINYLAGQTLGREKDKAFGLQTLQSIYGAFAGSNDNVERLTDKKSVSEIGEKVNESYPDIDINHFTNVFGRLGANQGIDVIQGLEKSSSQLLDLLNNNTNLTSKEIREGIQAKKMLDTKSYETEEDRLYLEGLRTKLIDGVDGDTTFKISNISGIGGGLISDSGDVNMTASAILNKAEEFYNITDIVKKESSGLNINEFSEKRQELVGKDITSYEDIFLNNYGNTNEAKLIKSKLEGQGLNDGDIGFMIGESARNDLKKIKIEKEMESFPESTKDKYIKTLELEKGLKEMIQTGIFKNKSLIDKNSKYKHLSEADKKELAREEYLDSLKLDRSLQNQFLELEKSSRLLTSEVSLLSDDVLKKAKGFIGGSLSIVGTLIGPFYEWVGGMTNGDFNSSDAWFKNYARSLTDGYVNNNEGIAKNLGNAIIHNPENTATAIVGFFNPLSKLSLPNKLGQLGNVGEIYNKIPDTVKDNISKSIEVINSNKSIKNKLDQSKKIVSNVKDYVKDLKDQKLILESKAFKGVSSLVNNTGFLIKESANGFRIDAGIDAAMGEVVTDKLIEENFLLGVIADASIGLSLNKVLGEIGPRINNQDIISDIKGGMFGDNKVLFNELDKIKLGLEKQGHVGATRVDALNFVKASANILGERRLKSGNRLTTDKILEITNDLIVKGNTGSITKDGFITSNNNLLSKLIKDEDRLNTLTTLYDKALIANKGKTSVLSDSYKELIQEEVSLIRATLKQTSNKKINEVTDLLDGLDQKQGGYLGSRIKIGNERKRKLIVAETEKALDNIDKALSHGSKLGKNPKNMIINLRNNISEFGEDTKLGNVTMYDTASGKYVTVDTRTLITNTRAAISKKYGIDKNNIINRLNKLLSDGKINKNEYKNEKDKQLKQLDDRYNSIVLLKKNGALNIEVIKEFLGDSSDLISVKDYVKYADVGNTRYYGYSEGDILNEIRRNEKNIDISLIKIEDLSTIGKEFKTMNMTNLVFEGIDELDFNKIKEIKGTIDIKTQVINLKNKILNIKSKLKHGKSIDIDIIFKEKDFLDNIDRNVKKILSGNINANTYSLKDLLNIEPFLSNKELLKDINKEITKTEANIYKQYVSRYISNEDTKVDEIFSKEFYNPGEGFINSDEIIKGASEQDGYLTVTYGSVDFDKFGNSIIYVLPAKKSFNLEILKNASNKSIDIRNKNKTNSTRKDELRSMKDAALDLMYSFKDISKVSGDFEKYINVSYKEINFNEKQFISELFDVNEIKLVNDTVDYLRKNVLDGLDKNDELTEAIVKNFLYNFAIDKENIIKVLTKDNTSDSHLNIITKILISDTSFTAKVKTKTREGYKKLISGSTKNYTKGEQKVLRHISLGYKKIIDNNSFRRNEIKIRLNKLNDLLDITNDSFKFNKIKDEIKTNEELLKTIVDPNFNSYKKSNLGILVFREIDSKLRTKVHKLSLKAHDRERAAHLQGLEANIYGVDVIDKLKKEHGLDKLKEGDKLYKEKVLAYEKSKKNILDNIRKYGSDYEEKKLDLQSEIDKLYRMREYKDLSITKLRRDIKRVKAKGVSRNDLKYIGAEINNELDRLTKIKDSLLKQEDLIKLDKPNKDKIGKELNKDLNKDIEELNNLIKITDSDINSLNNLLDILKGQKKGDDVISNNIKNYKDELELINKKIDKLDNKGLDNKIYLLEEFINSSKLDYKSTEYTNIYRQVIDQIDEFNIEDLTIKFNGNKFTLSDSNKVKDINIDKALNNNEIDILNTKLLDLEKQIKGLDRDIEYKNKPVEDLLFSSDEVYDSVYRDIGDALFHSNKDSAISKTTYDNFVKLFKLEDYTHLEGDDFIYEAYHGTKTKGDTLLRQYIDSFKLDKGDVEEFKNIKQVNIPKGLPKDPEALLNTLLKGIGDKIRIDSGELFDVTKIDKVKFINRLRNLTAYSSEKSLQLKIVKDLGDKYPKTVITSGRQAIPQTFIKVQKKMEDNGLGKLDYINGVDYNSIKSNVGNSILKFIPRDYDGNFQNDIILFLNGRDESKLFGGNLNLKAHEIIRGREELRKSFGLKEGEIITGGFGDKDGFFMKYSNPELSKFFKEEDKYKSLDLLHTFMYGYSDGYIKGEKSFDEFVSAMDKLKKGLTDINTKPLSIDEKRESLISLLNNKAKLDGDNYIIGEKKYKRLSSYIYEQQSKGQVKQSNSELTNFQIKSIRLGKGLHNIVEDIISKSDLEYDPKLFNTKKEFNTFIKGIKSKIKEIESNGEKLFVKNTVLHSDKNAIASEVNIFSIDKEGKVRIYDFATIGDEVDGVKRITQDKIDRKNMDAGIRADYQKQMLYEMTGIEAVEFKRIGVKLNYNTVGDELNKGIDTFDIQDINKIVTNDISVDGISKISDITKKISYNTLEEFLFLKNKNIIKNTQKGGAKGTDLAYYEALRKLDDNGVVDDSYIVNKILDNKKYSDEEKLTYLQSVEGYSSFLKNLKKRDSMSAGTLDLFEGSKAKYTTYFFKEINSDNTLGKNLSSFVDNNLSNEEQLKVFKDNMDESVYKGITDTLNRTDMTDKEKVSFIKESYLGDLEDGTMHGSKDFSKLHDEIYGTKDSNTLKSHVIGHTKYGEKYAFKGLINSENDMLDESGNILTKTLLVGDNAHKLKGGMIELNDTDPKVIIKNGIKYEIIGKNISGDLSDFKITNSTFEPNKKDNVSINSIIDAYDEMYSKSLANIQKQEIINLIEDFTKSYANVGKQKDSFGRINKLVTDLTKGGDTSLLFTKEYFGNKYNLFQDELAKIINKPKAEGYEFKSFMLDTSIHPDEVVIHPNNKLAKQVIKDFNINDLEKGNGYVVTTRYPVSDKYVSGIYRVRFDSTISEKHIKTHPENGLYKLRLDHDGDTITTYSLKDSKSNILARAVFDLSQGTNNPKGMLELTNEQFIAKLDKNISDGKRLNTFIMAKEVDKDKSELDIIGLTEHRMLGLEGKSQISIKAATNRTFDLLQNELSKIDKAGYTLESLNNISPAMKRTIARLSSDRYTDDSLSDLNILVNNLSKFNIRTRGIEGNAIDFIIDKLEFTFSKEQRIAYNNLSNEMKLRKYITEKNIKGKIIDLSDKQIGTNINNIVKTLKNYPEFRGEDLFNIKFTKDNRVNEDKLKGILSRFDKEFSLQTGAVMNLALDFSNSGLLKFPTDSLEKVIQHLLDDKLIDDTTLKLIESDLTRLSSGYRKSLSITDRDFDESILYTYGNRVDLFKYAKEEMNDYNNIFLSSNSVPFLLNKLEVKGSDLQLLTDDDIGKALFFPEIKKTDNTKLKPSGVSGVDDFRTNLFVTGNFNNKQILNTLTQFYPNQRKAMQYMLLDGKILSGTKTKIIGKKVEPLLKDIEKDFRILESQSNILFEDLNKVDKNLSKKSLDNIIKFIEDNKGDDNIVVATSLLMKTLDYKMNTLIKDINGNQLIRMEDYYSDNLVTMFLNDGRDFVKKGIQSKKLLKSVKPELLRQFREGLEIEAKRYNNDINFVTKEHEQFNDSLDIDIFNANKSLDDIKNGYITNNGNILKLKEDKNIIEDKILKETTNNLDKEIFLLEKQIDNLTENSKNYLKDKKSLQGQINSKENKKNILNIYNKELKEYNNFNDKILKRSKLLDEIKNITGIRDDVDFIVNFEKHIKDIKSKGVSKGYRKTIFKLKKDLEDIDINIKKAETNIYKQRVNRDYLINKEEDKLTKIESDRKKYIEEYNINRDIYIQDNDLIVGQVDNFTMDNVDLLTSNIQDIKIMEEKYKSIYTKIKEIKNDRVNELKKKDIFNGKTDLSNEINEIFPKWTGNINDKVYEDVKGLLDMHKSFWNGRDIEDLRDKQPEMLDSINTVSNLLGANAELISSHRVYLNKFNEKVGIVIKETSWLGKLSPSKNSKTRSRIVKYGEKGRQIDLLFKISLNKIFKKSGNDIIIDRELFLKQFEKLLKGKFTNRINMNSKNISDKDKELLSTIYGNNIQEHIVEGELLWLQLSTDKGVIGSIDNYVDNIIPEVTTKLNKLDESFGYNVDVLGKYNKSNTSLVEDVIEAKKGDNTLALKLIDMFDRHEFIKSLTESGISNRRAGALYSHIVKREINTNIDKTLDFLNFFAYSIKYGIGNVTHLAGTLAAVQQMPGQWSEIKAAKAGYGIADAEGYKIMNRYNTLLDENTDIFASGIGLQNTDNQIGKGFNATLDGLSYKIGGRFGTKSSEFIKGILDYATSPLGKHDAAFDNQRRLAGIMYAMNKMGHSTYEDLVLAIDKYGVKELNRFNTEARIFYNELGGGVSSKNSLYRLNKIFFSDAYQTGGMFSVNQIIRFWDKTVGFLSSWGFNKVLRNTELVTQATYGLIKGNRIEKIAAAKFLARGIEARLRNYIYLSAMSLKYDKFQTTSEDHRTNVYQFTEILHNDLVSFNTINAPLLQTYEYAKIKDSSYGEIGSIFIINMVDRFFNQPGAIGKLSNQVANNINYDNWNGLSNVEKGGRLLESLLKGISDSGGSSLRFLDMTNKIGDEEIFNGYSAQNTLGFGDSKEEEIWKIYGIDKKEDLLKLSSSYSTFGTFGTFLKKLVWSSSDKSFEKINEINDKLKFTVNNNHMFVKLRDSDVEVKEISDFLSKGTNEEILYNNDILYNTIVDHIKYSRKDTKYIDGKYVEDYRDDGTNTGTQSREEKIRDNMAANKINFREEYNIYKATVKKGDDVLSFGDFTYNKRITDGELYSVPEMNAAIYDQEFKRAKDNIYNNAKIKCKAQEGGYGEGYKLCVNKNQFNYKNENHVRAINKYVIDNMDGLITSDEELRTKIAGVLLFLDNDIQSEVSDITGLSIPKKFIDKDIRNNRGLGIKNKILKDFNNERYLEYTGKNELTEVAKAAPYFKNPDNLIAYMHISKNTKSYDEYSQDIMDIHNFSSKNIVEELNRNYTFQKELEETGTDKKLANFYYELVKMHDDYDPNNIDNDVGKSTNYGGSSRTSSYYNPYKNTFNKGFNKGFNKTYNDMSKFLEPVRQFINNNRGLIDDNPGKYISDRYREPDFLQFKYTPKMKTRVYQSLRFFSGFEIQNSKSVIREAGAGFAKVPKLDITYRKQKNTRKLKYTNPKIKSRIKYTKTSGGLMRGLPYNVE